MEKMNLVDYEEIAKDYASKTTGEVYNNGSNTEDYLELKHESEREKGEKMGNKINIEDYSSWVENKVLNLMSSESFLRFVIKEIEKGESLSIICAKYNVGSKMLLEAAIYSYIEREKAYAEGFKDAETLYSRKENSLGEDIRMTPILE